MSRICRLCRRTIPAGQAIILNAREAGSGAPVAVYAHRECPPEETPAGPATEEPPAPRYVPPRPPAGFHQ